MKLIASFPTERGASLMATMAKHFGHKLTVTSTEHSARFGFDGGSADIALIPEGLHLSVEAPDRATADELRDVIERHLLRFAHRDDPQPLIWSDAG